MRCLIWHAITVLALKLHYLYGRLWHLSYFSGLIIRWGHEEEVIHADGF